MLKYFFITKKGENRCNRDQKHKTHRRGCKIYGGKAEKP